MPRLVMLFSSFLLLLLLQQGGIVYTPDVDNIKSCCSYLDSFDEDDSDKIQLDLEDSVILFNKLVSKSFDFVGLRYSIQAQLLIDFNTVTDHPIRAPPTYS